MLKLQSLITFTPKDTGLTNQSTSTELIDVLSRPLEAPRKEIVFDFVCNVEITDSFKDLTQTCEITLPRKVFFEGHQIATKVNSIFKRGDKVKVELGYAHKDLGLRTVFEGYVSTISMSTPLRLTCEDSMYLLKRKKILWPLRYGTITKGKRGTTLKHPKIIPTKIALSTLVDTVLLEGTGIKSRILTDIEIPVKRLDSPASEVLALLKKEFGVYSYFVGEVLHCGLASDASRTDTVEFEFEEHIIDDTSLEYKRKDDYPLRIEAESINTKTNAREKVEVGEPDGQHKKFFVQNATKEELTRFAQAKLYEERAYEGYVGSFLSFGEPFIRPGDAAKMFSKRYPEKDGTYAVEAVRRTFGTSGYRQQISIAQKYS